MSRVARILDWAVPALAVLYLASGIVLMVLGQSGMVHVVGGIALLALARVFKLERRVDQLAGQVGNALTLNQRMLDLLDKGPER